MKTGWTKYAFENEFVEQINTGIYFKNMRCGKYLATGRDIDNRPIRREYVIDQSDRRSPWAMWNDFNGRWGLTNIYFFEETPTTIYRRLIYRQY